jgi:hypothetical protein
MKMVERPKHVADNIGSCEFGIEPYRSIKCWETIESKQLGAFRVVISTTELGRERTREIQREGGH